MSDRLELTYDLFALPSSQHRAGLAGLVLVHQTLQRLGGPDLPEVTCTDDGLVRVVLTEESVSTLLNEIYDASIEERPEPRARPPKRSGEVNVPLRTENVTDVDRRTGKVRSRTVYVYPEVVPRARCLQALEMPQPWIKLWREALWNTLRIQPTTRGAFNQRAAGESVAEARATWDELCRWHRDMQRGRWRTGEVAGSLFIGAQSQNAEQVRFRGRPDETLLLHFWPTVMGVAEARTLKLEKGQVNEGHAGFVIVVPDVADLTGFVEDFVRTVPQLDREMAGYRPRSALVSLPQESALEYLHHLGVVSQGRARQGALSFSVAGFDVFHLERRDKILAALETARVPASRGLLQQYDLIRRDYGNLLFRRQLISNLLAGRAWYGGFDRLFNANQRQLFFASGRQGFASNVRHRFQAEISQ
jgi:CRISPR-associated protein Cmx8